MTTIKTKKYTGANLNYAYLAGRADVLRELIKVFKPRPPLEEYTTNVILLELETRLNELEE